MKTKILKSTSYILGVSVILSLLFTINTSCAQRASYATLETKEITLAYFSNSKPERKTRSVVIDIEAENEIEAWLFDPKSWEIEEINNEALLEDRLLDEKSWEIEPDPEFDNTLEDWLYDEKSWEITPDPEFDSTLFDWLYDEKSWEIVKKDN